MKFWLEFKTENAAFQDGNGPMEAARILLSIVGKLGRGEEIGVIFDDNGNRVGDWAVDFPGEEDE